ncbi:MAG: ArnT family glycosyltransferase [Desulfomonilaceae bacterium]
MRGGTTKVQRIDPLWYVILIALVIRAFIPLYAEFVTSDPDVFYEIHSYQYLEPAQNLIKSGQFTTDAAPEIYRPPGYSILLIPGILLNHVPLVTILIQILLSCLTVYLVFEIAIVLFGRSEIGILSAALYAIDPLSVIFSSLIMPETFATFALSLFLLFLFRYLREESVIQLSFAAIALATTVYLQAIAYFLPVWIASFLAFFAINKRSGTRVLHALIFLVISMSLIGIWQIRNRIETGYSGFSTVFDKSLYYAQAASVLAKLEGKRDFRELWNLMDRKVNEHSARFRERFEYMREEGTRLTLAHPWMYAEIHIQGILRTLSGAEAHTYIRLLKFFHGTEEGWQELITRDLLDAIRHNSNNLTHAAILTIAGLGLIVMLVYLFAAVALFSKKLLYAMPVVCSLWVVVYWLVITGGPHGYGRYRHAVMPIICVLAGYGLHLILSRFRHMSRDGGLRGPN